jgi:hypothetical protein
VRSINKGLARLSDPLVGSRASVRLLRLYEQLERIAHRHTVELEPVPNVVNPYPRLLDRFRIFIGGGNQPLEGGQGFGVPLTALVVP